MDCESGGARPEEGVRRSIRSRERAAPEGNWTRSQRKTVEAAEEPRRSECGGGCGEPVGAVDRSMAACVPVEDKEVRRLHRRHGGGGGGGGEKGRPFFFFPDPWGSSGQERHVIDCR